MSLHNITAQKIVILTTILPVLSWDWQAKSWLWRFILRLSTPRLLNFEYHMHWWTSLQHQKICIYEHLFQSNIMWIFNCHFKYCVPVEQYGLCRSFILYISHQICDVTDQGLYPTETWTKFRYQFYPVCFTPNLWCHHSRFISYRNWDEVQNAFIVVSIDIIC
jgi:hypothetical protein